jgi:5'(3')-deoxyribonucleotidase
MMMMDEGWRTPEAPAMLPGALKMNPAIVGVDCDGVLASDRLLWQVMRKHYPAQIPARYEDLRGYDWPRVTAETTQLCLRLSADPAFAGRLAPIPHMADALRHLREAGYRPHVVTARPPCVRHATRRWLARHGVADCVEGIHCVGNPLEKVDLALALGCVAFVEDNHATAEALGAAGVRSYLLDAPYNRLPERYSIRVRDWRELLDCLLRDEPLAHAHVPVAPTLESPAPLAS